ncbi:MAG: DUF721 domain-containing protein [Deltaproteobacteria bacterium]|nr:DUF721 domain-containing protein [Deltaproteobacteria bacterium]
MNRRKYKRLKTPMSSLSQELTSTLRTMGEGARFIHPEIWARWFQIAGEQLYQKTFPRMFKDSVLTIAVTNSTWMHQLSFMRPQLLDRLAEEVGPNVVKEIRFVLDTSVGKNRRVTERVQYTPLPKADPERISNELRDAADKIDDPELALLIKRAASRYDKQRRFTQREEP